MNFCVVVWSHVYFWEWLHLNADGNPVNYGCVYTEYNRHSQIHDGWHNHNVIVAKIGNMDAKSFVPSIFDQSTGSNKIPINRVFCLWSLSCY